MNSRAERTLNQGKYILDTQLGKGIFSLTYRGTNQESGQIVVIKTLGAALRGHPDFQRFKQQFLAIAQSLSNCHHPHLVQVLDWFEEDEFPYLVMEYIPGQSLAEVMQTEALPPAKAIDYITQIGDALALLHRADLLHQDIKPENIIRCPDSDCVVLVEIGITCEFTPGIIQTQASLLSAGYAPLEQYTSEDKRSPATDLYALAATLYCLLTGEPPLPAPVRKTWQGELDNCLFTLELDKKQDNISPVLKQALACALEIYPEKRPQSLDAWLAQLSSIEQPLSEPKIAQEEEERENRQPQQQLNQLHSSNDRVTLGGLSSFQDLSIEKQEPLELATEKLNSNFKAETALLKTAKAKARSLLQALLLTGAIAASAGVGFGFALRTNSPAQPGSSILHTQQTFPPRSDWPVSESQL